MLLSTLCLFWLLSLLLSSILTLSSFLTQLLLVESLVLLNLFHLSVNSSVVTSLALFLLVLTIVASTSTLGLAALTSSFTPNEPFASDNINLTC